MMKIPVFVSCPTSLSPAQDEARQIILRFLDDFDLELRALGRSDYPAELPLREVLVIARHCAGGVILGFEQFRATAGMWNPGRTEEPRKERLLKANEFVPFPTPWNQLEAGILFGLGLPMLIFTECIGDHCISGGVFDKGATDVFVNKVPSTALPRDEEAPLKHVFLKWHARVSARYYSGVPTP